MNAFKSIHIATILATGALRRGRGVTYAGAEVARQGSPAIGIALEDADSGALGRIVTLGEMPCLSGAAITLGAEVQFDSQGRVIPWDGLGGQACGIAMEAASAAGEYPRVYLQPAGMATGHLAKITASGAITQGRAVGFDNAQVSVAGTAVKGFAVATAADGETAFIVRGGPVQATAGGTISAGDALQVDNQGRVIVLDAGAPCGRTDAASSVGNSVQIWVK